MIEGFMFANAGDAMEFYERCEIEGAETYEERMAVLRQLVKEKKVKYVRDPLKMLEGKNVLRVRRKDDLR